MSKKSSLGKGVSISTQLLEITDKQEKDPSQSHHGCILW